MAWKAWMWRRSFLFAVVCVAFPAFASEDVSCSASEGECIITGYYDYDPKQREVDILVEPRTLEAVTTYIRLPGGRARGQSWQLETPADGCSMEKRCDNGAELQCYTSAPCGRGESGDSIWCGQFVPGIG
ncbi:MAG: hypothetical protein ACR2PZ_10400, partial [Pseudomonadales bacterium]